MLFRSRKKIVLWTVEGAPRKALMTIFLDAGWKVDHIDSTTNLSHMKEDELPLCILVDAVNGDIDSTLILSLSNACSKPIAIVVILNNVNIAHMMRLVADGADMVIPAEAEAKDLLVALCRYSNKSTDISF